MIPDRHKRLLRFIIGYQEAHGGVSPTFAQMSVAVYGHPKTKQGISNILDQLERWGRIRRLKNRVRAIEVVRPVSIPRAPDGAPLYFIEPAPINLASLPVGGAQTGRGCLATPAPAPSFTARSSQTPADAQQGSPGDIIAPGLFGGLGSSLVTSGVAHSFHEENTTP